MRAAPLLALVVAAVVFVAGVASRTDVVVCIGILLILAAVGLVVRSLRPAVQEAVDHAHEQAYVRSRDVQR